MAGKSATIYLVDLGASTGECKNGRTESDLDYGMRYVWGKIADNMLANKVSASIGVIGFRTDETNNTLAADDDAYLNISELKPLGPMQMSGLTDLQKKIVPNESEVGDAVSALVVAIDLIDKFTMLKSGKPGKYERKIVLLTDGEGNIDDDDIGPIAEKINEVDIELLVAGIDFDDAEYGFKEEDKSKAKKRNETILRELTGKCTKGSFATVAETIESLTIPTVKETRPYKPYSGRLSLGNFEKYPGTSMYIEVERYSKTKIAKPVSASTFVTRSNANGPSSQQSSHTLQGETLPTNGALSGLAPVRTLRNYQINDAGTAGGKKDIDHEELAKGYEYGRTAVPISASEENVTNFNADSIPSFEIIGFIPNDNYGKYLSMGESCITIPMPSNDKARIALSSLVRALYELESYAVARLVAKPGRAPEMLLLAPSIEPDLEALIDVPLPFAEDIRIYRFPPLDRVITTSGGILKKHRNLPTDELADTVSAYVDSMDLSTFEKDEEGQPIEYMSIDDTYSPMLHRLNQAIRHKAVRPDEPIGPPAEILIKYSNPPSELVSDSAQQLSNLVKAADVKKVPPKAKGKRNREAINPISGLDIEEILGREKRHKITSNNSIAEFKQMLDSIDDTTKFQQAVKQLETIIHDQIKKSTGDSLYEQAFGNIRAMREEMIDYEAPETYNQFLKDLKKKIINDELGDGRNQFIYLLGQKHLSLIDKMEAESSETSKTEAAEFCKISKLPERSEA